MQIINWLKKKFKKQPYSTHTHPTTYLGINKPQEIKDLYSKNSKTLMKETEDSKKCRGHEKIILVKCRNY